VNNIYITCTKQLHKKLIDHKIYAIYISALFRGHLMKIFIHRKW